MRYVGMAVYISRDTLGTILREAVAAAPRECCGLLLSTDDSGRIDTCRPAGNVAESPASRFEIDPHVLLAAHRAQRSGGPAIAGCYHSHPMGEPRPSAIDAAQAEGKGEVWLICTSDGKRATAWIARPGGSIHGMFEDARLIVD